MNDNLILSMLRGTELETEEIMTKLQVLKRHEHFSVHQPTEANPRYYVWVRTEDGKKLQAQSEEKLIEKLCDYYSNTTEYSFKKVFEDAFEEHIKLHVLSPRTIDDYRDTYNFYIDDEFSKVNVKTLKASELREYMLKVAEAKRPKKKHFKRFITILNLVFNYCLNEEHQIRISNPMTHDLKVFEKYFSDEHKEAKDKCYSPEEIENLTKAYLQIIAEGDHDKKIKAYACLFAINTGCRISEIPSLKWDDFRDGYIHIHTSQLVKSVDGHNVYYFCNSTKDEKGCSKGGRYIKATQNLKLIFNALLKLKTSEEYVFALNSGEWITLRQIDNMHRTTCKKLGLKLTNIHAIRMYINSYVLRTNDEATVADCAKFLGHTERVNIEHYTFESRNYADKMVDVLDAKVPSLATQKPPCIIDFPNKKRAL